MKALFLITITTMRMIFPGLVAMPPTADKAPVPLPIHREVVFEVIKNSNPVSGAKASVMAPGFLGSDKYAKLKVEQGSPYDDSGTGTYAYWPVDDKNEISDKASVVGEYKLYTTFAGNTSVKLDKDQEFLDAIDLINSPEKADFKEDLKIQWNKIPRVVGYAVYALGGDGQKTIMWNAGGSSLSPQKYEEEAVGTKELGILIKDGVLLSADTQSVTIPKDKFAASDFIIVTIAAIGNDITNEGKTIDSRVIVRSISKITITGASKKSE
jgi:hypothetical protein